MVKFPWDLYWENKTYKINRSIDNSTVISARVREREKRQGMKLIWGPIYFQAVLKYYTRFFHKT